MPLLGIIASSKKAKTYWDTIEDDGAYSAFKYDETTGSTVADFINALGMTGNGTFTLNQTGPGTTDVTKAISYNGSSGYHQTTSGDKAAYNVAPSGSWAVECWIKTTTASLSQPITVRGGNILCGLYLGLDTANKITALTTDSGGNELRIVGTTTVNDGNWHHIVGTAQSGGSFYLYVDGVQNAVSATARSASTANRSIGVAANIAVPTQYLNGLIAAPAFYTSYLTSSQVSSHYTKGTA
jgi:Concanavalin A-like lectin/glucanases superfamily